MFKTFISLLSGHASYQVNETEQFGAPPSKMTLGIVHHGR